MASSPAAAIILQVKQIRADLVKAKDDCEEERILDILSRLDGIEIDAQIIEETLEETKISKTVLDIKRKYSGEIKTQAKKLLKKWEQIWMLAQKEEEEETSPQAETVATTAAAAAAANDGNEKTTLCDICSKPRNFRDDIGMLQKCKDCGIHVHELCYCMVPTSTLNKNFKCHACSAVGTEVEVNVPSKIGGTDDIGKERDVMMVNERPMDCVLCRHNKEYHAMHPLYDTDGKQGRQLCLPRQSASVGGKPRRLAWVHTLCAQTLAIQKSYLFGVDKDGMYYDKDGKCCSDGIVDESNNKEEDDESSDEEVGGQKYKIGTKLYKEFEDPETKELRVFKGKVIRFDTKMKLYHVLYEDGDYEDLEEHEVKSFLQKPTKAPQKTEEPPPDNVATRNFCINIEIKEDIKEALKLKCVVCKRDDNGKLAIPIQCNAGDETEDPEFQKHHGQFKDPCLKAMHIGCEFFFCI